MDFDEINNIYNRCAICGFQFGDILDTVYIVPLVNGGMDTYDNKLGLCPNCHLMFDKGLILVDKTGMIYLNLRRATYAEEKGLIGSFEALYSELHSKTLLLPEDKNYHPSGENLDRAYKARQ